MADFKAPSLAWSSASSRSVSSSGIVERRSLSYHALRLRQAATDRSPLNKAERSQARHPYSGEFSVSRMGRGRKSHEKQAFCSKSRKKPGSGAEIATPAAAKTRRLKRRSIELAFPSPAGL
jgi:hypothetical protein